jgi:protein-S-isoprenylcysteine O-methyltransferase Ste14
MWKIIPELANQRGSMKSDTKSWDKVLVPVFILLSLLITPLVCGLDRGRFQWSEPGIGYTITGVVLIMIAYVIQTWAMIVNTHFEGTVRIQHDREHKVISSGPYSIIRHPGYSAMIVTSFAIPMIIGSIYGLIPGFIVAVILVIRTNFEDNTLKNELDGYNEYAHRVKYRLLKWVW